MQNSIISFSSKLLGLLAIAFGIHIASLYVRDLSLLGDHILISYGLNFILTIVIFITMIKATQKENAYAGFIFVFGSAFKFLIFLLILKPLFKVDGEISRLELASFFVPYLVCIIYEVYVLSKMLNNK